MEGPQLNTLFVCYSRPTKDPFLAQKTTILLCHQRTDLIGGGFSKEDYS